jgi:hypothetical protein
MSISSRYEIPLTDDYLSSLIELAEAEPYSQFAPALRTLWTQRDELLEALKNISVASCAAITKVDGD